MSERHPKGSETQEGPDWWMASDGRWYPPELHPEFRNARSVVIGDRAVGDDRESAEGGGLGFERSGRDDTGALLGANEASSGKAGALLGADGIGDVEADESEAISPTPEDGASMSTGSQAVPGLLGASTDQQTPESNESDSQPDPQPSASTAPIIETVAATRERVFSASEAVTPAAESTAPAAESTAPAAESTALAAESTALAAESTAPAAESTAAAAESTALAAESTALAAESTAPAAESTAPAAESTAPAAESTAPAAENAAVGAEDALGVDRSGSEARESERPAINIGSSAMLGPTATMPESTTTGVETSASSADSVVNPWTLPVRGRIENLATSEPDTEDPASSQSGHRIVLPGELDTGSAPQSIRPSGPTPVKKGLTFRPAEPTTVQAAVSVPVADDETPWYKRSPDGSEPAVSGDANTPNIYGGALSVAGGALAIVGALMTWATESGPLLDGFLWARKVPGFASNGGWVLVCGLLMGVAGVLSIIGIKPTGVWSIMSVVSGGLVLAAVLYSYADIVGAASEDWRTFVSASTGIDAVTLKARGVGLRPAFGLWLSAIAGLLGCAAGIYFKRDF